MVRVKVAFAVMLSVFFIGVERGHAASDSDEEVYQELYPWALNLLNSALSAGQPLNEDQKREAQAAGVEHPEKIRLLILNELPSPDSARLKQMPNRKGGFNWETFSKDTLGLTLGYAICLRSDHVNDRSLVNHEFVHVAQQERLGGFEKFFKVYIKELSQYGYWQSPLEREAFEWENYLKQSQSRDF